MIRTRNALGLTGLAIFRVVGDPDATGNL